jgi:adenosylcobyric acid synthase
MKPLFIGGTASHVGKSWFATAFCRLLRKRGVRVAPFKAQNMSNNSYPCIEGGEIGRAQATQAEACRLPAMADMNPVLLKPNSPTGSQVVVQGRVWAAVEAMDYANYTTCLFEKAVESYRRLAGQFEQIVCEGAGSVAEVNLYHRDITNLRFAEAIDARVLLVAGIERGGVFASLVGTLDLLPAAQRKLVEAFAVNRFRGDRRLFDEGLCFLENRLGIPCLGVFPLDSAIKIDDEDSLSLDDAPRVAAREIGVIRLPRISNFTDFQALAPVDWIESPIARHQYRIVFIPGTKNTVDDLQWLRRQRLDHWLREQQRGGASIIGICGGYQMLGERVEDPDRIESLTGSVEGLGFLPVSTTLRSPKVTRTVQARTAAGYAFEAYEIHMGETRRQPGFTPFVTLANGNSEGCRAPGIIGTYLHGAFDHPEVVAEYLNITIHPRSKEDHYDRLAVWLESNANAAILERLLA